MQIFNIKDFSGGWYIGNFNPSILQTKDFEIGFKLHLKGDVWPAHYHKISKEYNLLISGLMVIQNTEIKPGDIFIIEQNEVADPVFLEDCSVITVKVPSSPGDKYVL